MAQDRAIVNFTLRKGLDVNHTRRSQMSKTVAAIAAAILGLCAVAQAGSNAARIDVSGTGEKVALAPGKAEGGTISIQGWLKEEEKQKQSITTSFAASADWKSGSFSFTPDKDGKVDIVLIGQWSKEPADRSWVIFDNVKAEGAELKNGDFENGSTSWWLNVDKEGVKATVLDTGKDSMHSVKVNHDHQAIQKLGVKAGQPVTISFDYKLAE